MVARYHPERMLKRYIHELGKHATSVFSLAALAIALVWFIPPVLSRLGQEAIFPRSWLDQALLSAAAAVVALLVGSYLAWRDAVRRLDQHQEAAEGQIPVVTLGGGTFAGNYSSPVNSTGRVMIPIERIQNRSAHHVYLEPPTVYKWGLPPPVGSPGPLTLFGRDGKNRRSTMTRAAIAPENLTFGLEVEIRVQLEVKTAEELAAVLKRLRGGGSVTLRCSFSPDVAKPVDQEARVDFDSFCSQVLGWWEQEKRTDLLRIYGDS